MTVEQRRTAAVVATSLTALLLAAPGPHDALVTLVGIGAAPEPTAPVVALVALVAWAVAGWLALTALLVALSHLPGLFGRGVGVLARRVAPQAVRRTVEATLGLTVAVGVLAPGAALAAPVAGPPSVTTADRGWDLDWPDAPSAPAPTAAASRPAPLPPALPTVRPSTPAVRPAASVAVPSAAASVVVRVGDSLWSVAEASLRRSGAAPTDRQVALTWPRWWAANREAVGDDPDLLLPGTVLRPPV